MKKTLIVLAFSACCCFSCCKSTDTGLTPDQFLANQTVDGGSQIPVGSFLTPNGKLVTPMGVVVEDNMVYVSGSGNMSITRTSENQARAQVASRIAEYVDTAVKTAMQDYAADAGFANSDAERDFQATVSNAMGAYVVAQANYSGLEYIGYNQGDDGTIYVLARISTKNLTQTLNEQVVEITKKDAAVQASREASNFFTRLTNEGIF